MENLSVYNSDVRRRRIHHTGRAVGGRRTFSRKRDSTEHFENTIGRGGGEFVVNEVLEVSALIRAYMHILTFLFLYSHFVRRTIGIGRRAAVAVYLTRTGAMGTRE